MIETIIDGELIRYDPGAVMGFEFVKHKPRPKCGAVEGRLDRISQPSEKWLDQV